MWEWGSFTDSAASAYLQQEKSSPGTQPLPEPRVRRTRRERERLPLPAVRDARANPVCLQAFICICRGPAPVAHAAAAKVHAPEGEACVCVRFLSS